LPLRDHQAAVVEGEPRMPGDSAAVSRIEVIWGLLAARAAGRGAPVSVQDACALCAAMAGASGAAVTTSFRSTPGHVMCVTDELSEQLEELQLTFGEGPRVDAYTGGAPVLVPDLGEAGVARRWPAFGPAARLAGAAAVFALPLQIGVIRVGVVGLYRRQPGPLSLEQLGNALVFADAATVLLLDRQDPAAAGRGGTGPGGQSGLLALHRGRDRLGHRDAHRAAGSRHRGGIRPAACIRLCSRQAPGGCGS
jgi:hypothetical protein